MFSPKRTALCVAIVAAMGLAANEASAGCKLISGTRVCASWITGSEICQVGADQSQFVDPLTDVQCIVRGLASGDGTADNPLVCNDATLFGAQTCEAGGGASTNGQAGSNGNGVAWAGSNPARQGPKCDHDKFDPHKNPACGTPDLGGGLLESPIVPLTCDNNGICTATAEVGVPEGGTCSGGGTLLDFTATQFVGVVLFNADDGVEGFAQLCTIDPNGHTYTCTDPNTTNFDSDSCLPPPPSD